MALTGVLLAAVWALRRDAGLPPAGSPAYERAASRFYRGLAALEVGLIDDAKRDFTEASRVAPGEPAIWANLGLAHLRLGEFDPSSQAIARAARLMPDAAPIVFLEARLETARGRPDEGIRDLRRAVELDSGNLRYRTALIQEIEDAGGPDRDAEAARLQDALATAAPGNVAVLVERARLAAKRGDRAGLADSLSRLQQFAARWPPEVVEQYRAVEQASAAGNMADASRAIAFLRNVLTSLPDFLEARRLVTPAAELVAEPLAVFLRLPAPLATADAADASLTFQVQPIGSQTGDTWRDLIVLPRDDAAPAVYAADTRRLARLDAAAAPLRLDSVPAATAALDWNHDFRQDLTTAGAAGVQLFQQSADGGLTPVPFRGLTPAQTRVEATGVWAADIEMDGDLDLVTGVRAARPSIFRNNGDGTWRVITPFTGIAGLRAFAWADLDRDGDPDAALIDGDGTLHVFTNLQAGQFAATPPVPNAAAVQALAAGDINGDGSLDLVTLDAAGAIGRVTSIGTGWDTATLATWAESPRGAASTARLMLADLDNNGALDVIAVRGARTAIWLQYPDRVLRRQQLPDAGVDVREAVDLDGDGQLDLAGVLDGRAVRLIGRGSLGYHSQVIRPRAQTGPGDQRINSFGIGGEIEVRSGRLVQKQVIAGPVVHVGLGSRTAAEIARIVWPNGVAQAEFDPPAGRPLVATQRLKGSCPWVFADDGSGPKFVTDFLWRSPLGLRINAQDTAGITQTEDWVRIRGDQLAARDGAYDIRITAELWETHFIDEVSLMTVDHPRDVSVFVDERFARESPVLEVRPLTDVHPVARAWDQTGRDVTAIVATQDGRALDSFAKGQYQGIAEDHFVEIDPRAPLAAGEARWLVAYGWIYPTDSSINVAIGQGRAVVPRGLSLEARDARGRWVVVAPDLGFPAGKNKTILIDLDRVARAGVSGADRLRLRTNLEIYWDAISIGTAAPAAAFETRRFGPSSATLRYRGFSATSRDRRDVPETPSYERISSTSPRWRDLIGYYTRFGDVRELVGATDDRYVIMNAGDELKLVFPAPAAPREGWTRDFVLIGDGWEKDGDFNTSFAKTVLPLPRHGRPDYNAPTATPGLEDDPVFRAHREDWVIFHTRFVDPSRYLRGLAFDLADAP